MKGRTPPVISFRCCRVGPNRYCSSRHETHFEHSFIESNKASCHAASYICQTLLLLATSPNAFRALDSSVKYGIL